MPDRDWSLLNSRQVSDHYVFRLHVDAYRLESNGVQRDFVRLDAPSWINVIPLTADNQVVMVRQYRHGVREVTLEIPGGMVDPNEAPEVAAARELREETGYEPSRIRRIGHVWPNPAILNNTCYFYLAEDVALVGAPEPDPVERIEVVTRPLADIPRLIRDGEIQHALVVAAFSFLGVTPKVA